jgi:hypothetical protein
VGTNDAEVQKLIADIRILLEEERRSWDNLKFKI